MYIRVSYDTYVLPKKTKNRTDRCAKKKAGEKNESRLIAVRVVSFVCLRLVFIYSLYISI